MSVRHGGKTYRGITLQNGKFVFRYTDRNGREHRLWFSTIDEAILRYHENRTSQREGGLPAPVVLRRNRVAFREIAEDALKYSDTHKRSARYDRWRMKKLLEWFGNTRAEALTARDIIEKFEGEAWKPATWNRHRALLSMTYREAMRSGKVSQNPARLVPQKAERNGRLRFLSPDEEQRLRKVIEERDSDRLAEFELALQTGLRLSEQYGALWDQVDWQRCQLTIPLDKSGRTSHVPLNDRALGALATLRSHSPAGARRSDSSLICAGLKKPGEWFRECVKAAELLDFTWHCLRHHADSRIMLSTRSTGAVCSAPEDA